MSVIKVAKTEWVKTRSGKEFLSVTDGNDDKHSIWDKKVATFVKENEGKRLDVVIEKNGDYSNIVAADLPPEEPAKNGNGGGRSPEQERRIVRESVLQSAVRLVTIGAQLEPEKAKGKLTEITLATANLFESWVYGENRQESAPSTQSARSETITTTPVATPETSPAGADRRGLLLQVVRLFNDLGGSKATETLAAFGIKKAAGEMTADELTVALEVLSFAKDPNGAKA